MTKKRTQKGARIKAARKARAAARSDSKSKKARKKRKKASKTAASPKSQERRRKGTGEPKASSETVRVLQYRPVYENGWQDDFELGHAECMCDERGELDAVASRHGVKAITALDVHGQLRTREDYHQLNSLSRIDELMELVEQAEVEWHDPNEAIVTIDGILGALHTDPYCLERDDLDDDFDEDDDFIDENSLHMRNNVIAALGDLRACLEKAAEQNTRFHFDLSIVYIPPWEVTWRVTLDSEGCC